MKAPSSRKVEHRLDHMATRRLHLGQCGFEVCAVEHQQGAASGWSGTKAGAEEAAVQPLAREGRVFG
eukprot:gene10231-13143_t